MTDKPPFYKLCLESMILLSIMKGEIPSPTDYPKLPAADPLWDIMRECWKEEPTERPKMVEVLQKVWHF